MAEMVRRSLVEPGEARRRSAASEPQLYRYPVIDPASFRRAVESAFA